MPIRKRNSPVIERTEKPETSPWGKVQTAVEVGPGVWRVYTAEHGGLMLSKARNMLIPFYMRDREAAYEEDIAACIPEVVFGMEVFAPNKVEAAIQQMKNSMPNEYERFFNTVIPEGESTGKDASLWLERHKNDFVVMGFWGDWAKFVPLGMVGVRAVQSAENIERWYLVPQKAFETSRSEFGSIVDQSVAQEISEPDEQDKLARSAEEVYGKEPTKVVNHVKVTLLVQYEDAPLGEPGKWPWNQIMQMNVPGVDNITVLGVERY